MQVGIGTSPLGCGNTPRPFMNHAKIGHWAGFEKPENVDMLDENGYLKPGKSGTFFIHHGPDCAGAYPTGEWTVFTNDDVAGHIGVYGAAKQDNEGWNYPDCGGVCAKYVVVETATTEGILVKFDLIPESKPLTYLGVFPGHHETPPSDLFTPEFLESMRGFPVIRMLNWSGINRRSELPESTYVWDKMPTMDTCSWITGMGGVPLEVQLRLCKEVGARPWLCIPHLMSDEDIAKVAELCYEIGVEPIVEHSNEVAFNDYTHVKDYCQERGLELGLSTNGYEARLLYHARRTVEISEIFAQELSDHNAVLGAQHDNPWTSKRPLEWLKQEDKLHWIDAIATAPYIQRPKSGELKEETIFEMLLTDVDALPRTIARGEDHAANAANHGVKLFAYEFNEHLESTDETLHNLYKWAARQQRMGEVITRQMDALEDIGYGLICGHCRCKGQSVNNFGFMQSEGDYESPKWKAIAARKQEIIQEPQVPPEPEPEPTSGDNTDKPTRTQTDVLADINTVATKITQKVGVLKKFTAELAGMTEGE